jgi:hypothetical protein
VKNKETLTLVHPFLLKKNKKGQFLGLEVYLYPLVMRGRGPPPDSTEEQWTGDGKIFIDEVKNND